MLFLFAYLGCEYGWVEFKCHCFLHVLDFVSWYDAKVRIVSHSKLSRMLKNNFDYIFQIYLPMKIFPKESTLLVCNIV